MEREQKPIDIKEANAKKDKCWMPTLKEQEQELNAYLVKCPLDI